MGRIFETRKATMFKRYARMAKAFTRIGREIVMAVKLGGPNPESNPRLRIVMQNAKAVNMPKANVDAAKKDNKDTVQLEKDLKTVSETKDIIAGLLKGVS